MQYPRVDSTGQWRIEARAMYLNELFKVVHCFWVIIDDNGYVVDQLHGMAVNPETGAIKAVGTAKDNLLVIKQSNVPNWDLSYTITKQPHLQVTCGGHAEMYSIWIRPDPLIQQLNDFPYTYPDTYPLIYEHLYKYNSNSVFNTMGRAMNFKRESYIDDNLNAPGVDKIMEPRRNEITGVDADWGTIFR